MAPASPPVEGLVLDRDLVTAPDPADFIDRHSESDHHLDVFGP